jgi:hypothetical protein
MEEDMMRDKGSAAVARYQAMAGLMKKLPPRAARRAREDRKRYGEEYVLRRKDKTLCDPVRMVRFLVKVCGLTMQEASKAVRAALRHNQCGVWPGGKSVGSLACEIYRRTKDLPDAMSMARFLGWSSDRPQVWEAVRVHLAGMQVTRESTGIENWLEAAE